VAHPSPAGNAWAQSQLFGVDVQEDHGFWQQVTGLNGIPHAHVNQ